MKTCTRRIVSWVAALTLLITCAISGLVLPTSAAVTNLVANGDFENGATGWDNSADIKEGVGKNGSWGLEMPVTNKATFASNYHWYKGNICADLEVGETYVISMDYNITKGAGTYVEFDVFADAALNQWLTTQKVHQGVTDGWQTWTYEFTVGESLSNVSSNVANGWTFEIRAVNYSVASQESMAYVDNVSIVKKSELEAAAAILWSEDYEDTEYADGIKNWTAKGEVTADPKDSTNKALKLTAAASTIYNGASMGMAKNKVYALSVDYLGGSLKVAFNGSKGFSASGATYAATTEWTTVTFYIVTTDSLANDGYSMNLTAPVDTYLDNITLTEIGDKGDIANAADGLLPGGDFEMANPVPWKEIMDKGATIVADPADATNKVLYFPAGYGKGAYWNQMKLNLKPDTTYTISMDVYGDAIWMYLNPDKGVATGGNWTEIAATGNEWTTVTHTFSTGASVANDTYMLGYGVDINATTGLYMDNVKITEQDAELTGITLNKTTADLTVGDTLTLNATAVPEDAALGDLTWESSNIAVATVADGVVTAVAAGTATITVKAGEITATCTVNVAAADTSVLVDEDFENGAQGVFSGATDTSTYWNVVNGGVDGGKALAITYKKGDRWLQWSTLTFEANTRYSVTFLAKGPTVRLGVYRYAGSATAKGGTFNVYTYPYQDDWTSYRLEFTTGANGFGNDPANSNYGMFFNRAEALTDETAVTLIDNFKIQKTDETTERIIGGDFTYPGMQQWRAKHLENTADGYVVVADPDDATNKVLKIPASTGNLGDNYLQNLYLEAGRTYEVSFKAKGAPMGLYMPNKQTSGGTLTGDKWIHTEESTEWKTYTYTFTATSTAAAGDQASWILNISRNVDVTGDTYIDDFSIKTKEIPTATAITLNKTTANIGINATETLTVSTTPEGAQYDSLTWASSNTAVATVVDGVVTGVASGEATITATAKVGETDLTATCTVKVVVKATSFEIVQDSLHLAPATNQNRLFVYDTITLRTVPADADTSNLTWTSDNEAVAKVENGTVQALAAGTATITVTDGTLSDTITVTVDDVGERVTGGDFEDEDWAISNYWTYSIIKNGSCELVADPANADNTVLAVPPESQAKWMWPAHVDAGVVYKLTMKVRSASGKATIHITPDYVQGSSDSGWVTKTIPANEWTEVSYIIHTVSTELNRNYLYGFGTNLDKSILYVDDVSMVQLPQATSIALENAELTVKGSKSLSVTATPTESNIGALTWESSDPSVITVDQNGKVTAVAGEGSVTITAKSANGSLSASCTVSIVGDYATAIKLTPAMYYAKKNSTLQLKMSTTPADARYKKPVWTSSDETIATVDQNGLVTVAAKEGTTTITVTCGTLTATSKVTVPGAAESFKLADESIKLAPGIGTTLRVQETLAIVTTPPNADPGELTWTSSNVAAATVDENGKVTALAEGETTITVTNATGTITDTCVVTVAWDGERITGGDFENDD